MARQIQNSDVLAESELRRDALAIAEAGYGAINVQTALRNAVRIDADELQIGGKACRLAGRRIFFVGVGKCAFAAALAIEDILGERLTGGVALDVSPITGRTPATIETYIGTHPLPSEVNEAATKRIMEFLAGREESDLVLMLISGGGSTLLCLHDAPMTCLDERTLFERLTACGTSIADINTVRKHISLARGGALAKAAYPAEVISLIVSDVPGNDLATIASGPTVLDASTVDDAKAVLARCGVVAPETSAFIETPKEQKFFDRVTNILFLSNQNALAAMKEEAEKRGYAAMVVDDRFSGEAKLVGRAIAEKLHVAAAPAALLYAGESTVTLGTEHGEGGPSPRRSGLLPRKGGRNQELALAALLDTRDGELVLPFSSDGHDNTDCAGAIADELTRTHASGKNISIETALETHHSYDFFAATGDGLHTGYTGSNVSDLIIALKNNPL